MKKYGQADIMCKLMHDIVENVLTEITPEQKKLLHEKNENTVFSEFPSARDLEVEQ